MHASVIAEHEAIVESSEWCTAVVDCEVTERGIVMRHGAHVQELEQAGWLFVDVGQLHPSNAAAVVIFRRPKQ